MRTDMNPRMPPMPTPFELREKLLDLVRRDLLGPADGEKEVFRSYGERVSRRYPLGGLAPGGTVTDTVADSTYEDEEPGEAASVTATEDDESTAADTLAIDGNEGPEASPIEREPVLVDSLLPSSAGFSCMVDGAEQELLVRASWGRYERGTSEEKDKNGKPYSVWGRIPVTPAPVRIPLTQGEGNLPFDEDPNIHVRWRMRRRDKLWHVTLFLVNTQSKKNRKDDSSWIFQASLSVESADGQERPIFVQRQHADSSTRDLLDPDERREMDGLDLRYSHCQVFGKGHGCAVKAYHDKADPQGRAHKLETDFLPIAHVPGQISRSEADDPRLQGIILDMAILASMPQDALQTNLTQLADAYAAWVDALPVHVEDSTLAAVANEAQEEARRALERMREGIAVLQKDANALRAFRFANKAMHYQRVHSIFARRVQGTHRSAAERAALLQEINQPHNHSWRLFQLAFVLANIPTLANPLHPERSGEGSGAVAQLLWFTTGGGKTEAYLGLTAFTLAMRRLCPKLGGLDATHGVGVFMRYTLRLLTLQQFQRAAALICACETLRRKDTQTWGIEPFRLGLWVGAKSTPNKLEQAKRQVDRTYGGTTADISTPVQFHSCPWCGAAITENNIKVRQGVTLPDRCITYCGDHDGTCPFTEKQAPDEGLPVMVVDEEIYRRPPSFLISTVDKFAQMPWKGEVEMLFGRVTGLCPRHGFTSPDVPDEHVGKTHSKYRDIPAARITEHGWLRPPDLVIQDELHLINGPLGSLTALYESAVDTLCQWTLDGRTVRPKVIASTATIRRATEQVRRLFNRRVEVFPPPGVDSRDNFFSLERPVSETCPGRVFMGICTTGNRMPPTTVRVYTSVMAAAQQLFQEYGAGADPWMTTVGYFNSVRELAGMHRLVEDEVKQRLEKGFQRGGLRRYINSVEELTSRQGSQHIPRILEHLAVPFLPPTENNPSPVQRAYDVVLATNMISVGVDIDRLGLMVILGQPKTTSEYIQASSRVGRSVQAPGLVVTIYSWARPRDLSHFEDFYAYHAAFHRHVEALSVTPFASRALDRGLAGVVVSLVRLLDSVMNKNSDAKNIQEHEDMWDNACQAIVQRASAITQDTTVVAHIEAMLHHLRDEWYERVRQCTVTGLCYSRPTSGDATELLQPSDTSEELFACPNSLRDVEKTVNLLLDMDDTGLSTREMASWQQ